jgi:hypothetical protein
VAHRVQQDLPDRPLVERLDLVPPSLPIVGETPETEKIVMRVEKELSP